MNPTNYPTSTRASDRRADYLDPHPLRWFLAFGVAVLVYFFVLATAGSLVNG